MYYVIKYKRASRFRPLPSSPLRGEGEGGVGKQRNAMRCFGRGLCARALRIPSRARKARARLTFLYIFIYIKRREAAQRDALLSARALRARATLGEREGAA